GSDRRSQGGGMLLVVRGGSQPRPEEARTAWQTEQVPALLPLLHGPGSRLGICALANLVSVHRSRGHERSRVVGAANGPDRLALPAARQLLCLDRGLGSCPTTHGRTVADGLARLAESSVGRGEPGVGNHRSGT